MEGTLKLHPREKLKRAAKSDLLFSLADWEQRHPNLSAAETLLLIAEYVESYLRAVVGDEWKRKKGREA